jgi:hypothetical protein
VDNIQKSILTVLGIAGFVALVIPDGEDMGVKPAPPVAVAPPPPPAPTPLANPDDELPDDSGDLYNDEEFANFGQPMADAQPVDYNSSEGGGSEASEPAQAAAPTSSPPQSVAAPYNGPGAPRGAVDAGAR